MGSLENAAWHIAVDLALQSGSVLGSAAWHIAVDLALKSGSEKCGKPNGLVSCFYFA